MAPQNTDGSFLSEPTSQGGEYLFDRACKCLTQPCEFEKMENSLSGTIWKSAVKPGKIYFVSILKIKLEMTVGIFLYDVPC